MNQINAVTIGKLIAAHREGDEEKHVKYLWLTADDDSDVKVYDQKRSVEYADYKPGMLYVSVYEVFPAETDAGLS